MYLGIKGHFGPINCRLTVDKNTGIGSCILPIGYSHVLSEDASLDWTSYLKSNTFAASIQAICDTLLDPAKLKRRIQKQSVTPHDLHSIIAKAGVRYSSMFNTVLCHIFLAKIGLLSYDSTFDVMEPIAVKNRELTTTQIVQLAELHKFVEAELFPLWTTLVSDSSAHVNHGRVGQDNQAPYYIGDTVCSNVNRAVRAFMKNVNERIVLGSVNGSYNTDTHHKALQRLAAVALLGGAKLEDEYALVIDDARKVLSYTNFFMDYVLEDGTFEKQSKAKDVAKRVLKIGDAKIVLRRVLDLLSAKYTEVESKTGSDLVSVMAPFTRLDTESMILPCHDAIVTSKNSHLILAECDVGLFGLKYKVDQTASASVNALVAKGRKFAIQFYDSLREMYSSIRTGIHTKNILDATTREAVKQLSNVAVLDTLLNGDYSRIKLKDSSSRLQMPMGVDVAATLQALGTFSYNGEYAFKDLGSAFSALAIGRGFPAKAVDPYYGVAFGDGNTEYSPTYRTMMVNDLKTMSVFNPQVKMSRIVFPKDSIVDSIPLEDMFDALGISDTVLMVQDMQTAQWDRMLSGTLPTLYKPAREVGLDMSDLCICALDELIAEAKVMCGDRVRYHLDKQHSRVHYMLSNMTENLRFKRAQNLSALRMMIDLIQAFDQDVAACLKFIVHKGKEMSIAYKHDAFAR